MKLGLGLYHHMLTEREFAFARQCGCTRAGLPRRPAQSSG